MQHGVILPSVVLIGLSLLFTSATVASEAEQYMTNQGVQIYQESENASLQGLNLSTLITNNGVIYVDKDKGIFFTKTSPMFLKNGSLNLLSQNDYQTFIDNIPNKIVHKSANEKIVVQMFTDISCGWCQKVHEDIESYSKAGITIEFILYPRNGLDSTTAKQMSTIANSVDPETLLQSAFAGEYISPGTLSPVLISHYQSGLALGVSGTPAFFIKGYPFEGYLQPQQVLAAYMR